MSKKHNHIAPLSPEQIEAYQEGTLSAEEMYAVEKYLLDNPFEAEALEGLEMLAPGTLPDHLSDLNARLDEQLAGETDTKVVFWTMTRKLAATLLILVTATFLYFQLDTQDAPIQTKNLSEVSKDPVEEPKQDTKLAEPKKDQDQESEPQLKEELEISKDFFADTNTNQTEDKETINEEKPIPELEAVKPTVYFADSYDTTIEDKTRPNSTLTANTKVSESLKTENGLVLNLNSLISTDSTTLLASQADFSTERQGRVAGVIVKDSNELPITNQQALLKTKAGDQEGQLGFIARDRVNGYLNSDSLGKLKAEEKRLETLTQLRAQNKAANKRFKAAPSLADSLSRKIIGKVTDDQGIPLRDVSVQIAGTSIGALTDSLGMYALNTSMLAGSIVFRYLGYSTLEVDIDNKSVLNVEISPSMLSVSEVVVSDYSPPVAEEEDKKAQRNHYPARPVYGQKAFSTHIKENLIYPEAAKTNKIRGRVLVEFTVKKNGDLADFKVLKGLGYGCDEEAIRLIKTGPRWQARISGIKEAGPVESKVKVRIKFKP